MTKQKDDLLERLLYIRTQLLNKGNICRYFRDKSFNNSFERSILSDN
jgi:hypothetical protein